MFQLEEIQAAHAKVKTGADFPVYIRDLIQVGIEKYDTYVRDGHTDFFGKDNFKIQSEPKYSSLDISDSGDVEQFKHYLKIHQQGETAYLVFCNHCAGTGVEKWTVDVR